MLSLMLRPPTAMERLLEADASAEASGSSAATLPPLPSGIALRMQQASWEDAGTGGLLWPAASVMCRWLSRQAAKVEGSRVLELGCGTGAVGLYAAGLGASRVLLTDGSDDVLHNCRRNITLNASAFCGAVDVATRKLSFGDSILPVGPWDWVLASDCVYANDWKALAQTVRGLVRAQDPPPRVILTIPHRRPGPVLSDAFRADAKGLRASTLEVERTPKHDGGGRLPSEQMVAVSVIELSRAGEPEEMRRQSSRQQL